MLCGNTITYLVKACEHCGEKNMLKFQFDHKGKYEKRDNITNMIRKKK